MIYKDNLICSAINLLLKTIYFFDLKRRKLLDKSVSSFDNKNISKETLYIVLNGPSLKEQDLSLLKDKNLLFVNRGFQHHLYQSLKPKFHMFIDPKMLSGEWDLNWIDYILEIVPDIIFIFPVSWASKNIFKPYIDRGISMIWIDDSTPATLLGVGGYSIRFGMDFNFNEIYFTGFEATGLAHEMINSQSHFYGVNSENLRKDTNDYIHDLYMFSRHLNDLKKLSQEARKRNIKIVNFTKGGLLDMFDRKNIENVS